MLSKSYWLAFSAALCIAFFSSAPNAQSLSEDQVKQERDRVIKERSNRIQRILQTKQNSQANTSAPVKPYIVGGTDAPVDAYPWMAALLFAQQPDARLAQICGGSLIREDLILTAAHCVEFFQPSDIQVAVGGHALADIGPEDRIESLAIFVHPDYDPATTDNDIALIRLAQPATQAPLVTIDTPIMDSIVPGELFTVMGWGVLNDFTFDLPAVLQEVQVPFVDYASCNDALFGLVTPNQICAGFPEGGRDSCYGDSGGPLIYSYNNQWFQAGIVSWGIGCAIPGFPGVYTKVSNYSQWIAEAADVLYMLPNHHAGAIGVDADKQFLVELTNWNQQSETIQAVSILPSDDFSVSEDDCTGRALSFSHSCLLEIKFKPSQAGRLLAILQVSTQAGTQVTSELRGIGLPEMDFNKALDTHEWEWFSGGDTAWSEVQDATSINGSALQSGTISDDQLSIVSTRVEGAGTLTFNWKVSSEAGYDFLLLMVGDEVINGITGETGWLTETVELSAGEHMVSWIYLKDYSVSLGEDSAWLDNVSWVKTEGAGNRSINSIPENNAESDSGGGGGASLFIPLALFLLLITRSSVRKA